LTIGTQSAHPTAPSAGSVDREGGGTKSPTQGGGLRADWAGSGVADEARRAAT